MEVSEMREEQWTGFPKSTVIWVHFNCKVLRL